MTYGLEWNSKASRGEAVRSKRLDSQLELFDLPAELLVIILKSLGYDELRSLEVSCSYLRWAEDNATNTETFQCLECSS